MPSLLSSRSINIQLCVMLLIVAYIAKDTAFVKYITFQIIPGFADLLYNIIYFLVTIAIPNLWSYIPSLWYDLTILFSVAKQLFIHIFSPLISIVFLYICAIGVQVYAVLVSFCLFTYFKLIFCTFYFFKLMFYFCVFTYHFVVAYRVQIIALVICTTIAVTIAYLIHLLVEILRKAFSKTIKDVTESYNEFKFRVRNATNKIYPIITSFFGICKTIVITCLKLVSILLTLYCSYYYLL